MTKVCPLFSGSKGNSYFIGSGSGGILIDAGRSAKQLTMMLEHCEIDVKAIQGIFITHEHSDHIKGLRVFASKHHISVYSSSGTLQALEKTGDLQGDFTTEVIDPRGMACGNLFIKPFHTSHDSAESIGFQIHTPDGHMIVLATDLGFLSDEIYREMQGSKLVIVESNHDVGMLENGPYPYALKKRILSKLGHLSNLSCSEILPDLVKQGTTHILLAHLSDENNTPDLALQTALCSLSLAGCQEGTDFRLEVAPRENQPAHAILL